MLPSLASAITDYKEFGEWFRVALEGPFVPGQLVRGKVRYPGYEHLAWEAIVQKIEPERFFSFTWHPMKDDNSVDIENETLVEFHLEPTSTGTLLTLTESGFDKLPADRRDFAFRKNDSGWTVQMQNINNHVTQKP
jgi:uncharacterized protein YndB with AHSA1/START domain